MTPIEPQLTSFETSRLTTLEIKVAVLESNQKEVDKKLDKIDTNISKLTWIVIGAVILAILKSTFGGGLF